MEQRHAGKQVGSGPPRVRQGLASLAALAFGLVASGPVAGCSAPVHRSAVPAAHAQGEERIRATYPPIEFVSPRDAIVRLMTTGNVTCTGTLIQDDLVVTAHHCLSARDKKGRVLDHDLDPSEIQVELGGDELPWGEVKVRAVVAPKCGYVAGDGDIAILVLERHLVGMPTYTVHIESPPKLADQVAIFGFGRCALSSGGIKRRDRPDAKVDVVAGDHFEAQASICPGDSGGPVLDTRYQLVGVISASVMDGDEATTDRSLFTRLDTWPQLFAAAHEISNGASPGELPPYGECRAAPPAPASPKKTWR